jgi:hypothetical protein
LGGVVDWTVLGVDVVVVVVVGGAEELGQVVGNIGVGEVQGQPVVERQRGCGLGLPIVLLLIVLYFHCCLL